MRHTLDYDLHYTSYSTILKGYCDANWIYDVKDLKSTSGYVFSFSEVVMTWKRYSQTCIARFMMELEFITLDKVRDEAKWLYNFLMIFHIG